MHDYKAQTLANNWNIRESWEDRKWCVVNGEWWSVNVMCINAFIVYIAQVTLYQQIATSTTVVVADMQRGSGRSGRILAEALFDCKCCRLQFGDLRLWPQDIVLCPYRYLVITNQFTKHWHMQSMEFYAHPYRV